MKRETTNLNKLHVSLTDDGLLSFVDLGPFDVDPELREQTRERLKWIKDELGRNERTSRLLYAAGLRDQAYRIRQCYSSFDLQVFRGEVETVAYAHCNLSHLCPFCARRRGNRLHSRYKEPIRQMLSKGYNVKLLNVDARFNESIRRADLRSFQKQLTNLMRHKVMKSVKGSLRFLEIALTQYGWLIHAHLILFVEGEIERCNVAKSWAHVDSDPGAVDIRPAKPTNLLGMIRYVCKPHEEFSSAAAIKSYYEETKGLRMAVLGGAALRSASVETTKNKKAKRSRQAGNAADQSACHKVMSNVNSRSSEFQELLRLL